GVLDSAFVSSDVFKVLGVQPAFGRVFGVEDDGVAAANVALISHNIAATLFGDPASAVGRTLNLDNQPSTIIGVMPVGFAFPSRNAQIWRPLRFPPPMLAQRNNHILFAVARLRPGVSLEAARTDMNGV